MPTGRVVQVQANGIQPGDTVRTSATDPWVTVSQATVVRCLSTAASMVLVQTSGGDQWCARSDFLVDLQLKA